ncbi:MAG: type II toxin-antitoxin system HicA family toxin [Acidimicrobiales bacterium]
MTARRLVRILRGRGYEPVRQRGSHQTWRCANCQTRDTPPHRRHPHRHAQIHRT